MEKQEVNSIVEPTVLPSVPILELKVMKELIEKADIFFSVKNGITNYECYETRYQVGKFLKPLDKFKVFGCHEYFELFVNDKGEVLAIAISSRYKRHRIITSFGVFYRSYANEYINLKLLNFTDSYISVEVCNLNHTIKKIKLGKPLAIIK